jgi:hypothetical protein
MKSSAFDPQTDKPEEGQVAKAIEHQTQRVPSDIFLWTALGFFGLSVAMQATGRKHSSLLLSQLAPTFLLLGIYNKLVKVAGSDVFEQKQNPAFGR